MVDELPNGAKIVSNQFLSLHHPISAAAIRCAIPRYAIRGFSIPEDKFPCYLNKNSLFRMEQGISRKKLKLHKN